MDSKKIIAVLLVVIVVLAAFSVVLAVQDKDDDSKDSTPKTSSDARLMVYGNANNDDVLDSKDLDVVKDLVENPDEWDKKTQKYADVNADGKISSDDTTLLQKILNNEKCIVYYNQFWYGNESVGHVHYPFTGSIGVEYYSTAYFLVALGLWDKVKYGDDRVTARAEYPTTNLSSLGTFGELTYDSLTAIKESDSSFTCLVAYGTADYSQQAQKDLWKTETDSDYIDVIALDVQGVNIETMLTLGTLLGAPAAAQKYAEYFDRVCDYLTDCVSDLDTDELVRFYNIYDDGDKGSIETHCYCVPSSSSKDADRYYPDLENILLIPSVNLEPDNTKIYAYHESDYFKDAPCIVITKTKWGSAYSYDTAYSTFSTDAKTLVEVSKAYDNKMVFGVAYEVLTSIYAPSVLPLLAYYMYGGEGNGYYDYDTCVGFLNEFYQNFTYPGFISTDFTAHGGSVFTL